MNLEQLKKLNLNDLATWPISAKLGGMAILFGLILFAAYALDWKNQWAMLEQARGEELQLREKFKEKKRLAINLAPYEQQLDDIVKQFGALLKQLPNKSEMEALITDINQAGLGRGLQFELFKPATQEKLTEFYAELPVTVKVSGSYHDLGSFASDIGKLSRIVLLKDMNVTTGEKGTLTMEATANTYRYLDEKEVEAQQKAAEKDKAKGANK